MAVERGRWRTALLAAALPVTIAAGGSGCDAPTATPTPAPARVLLAAVGDVMLARSVGARLETEGAAAPFAGAGDILARANIAANLESAIGVSGSPAPKGYTFQAPPVAAESIALAGIDLVSLANHALDYGPEALAETQALLAEQGVRYMGAGPNRAGGARPRHDRAQRAHDRLPRLRFRAGRAPRFRYARLGGDRQRDRRRLARHPHDDGRDRGRRPRG